MSDELLPNSTIRLAAKAGLNEYPDPSIDECTSGYNFDLAVNQAWFTPRSPFDLKGTAPNAGAITSLMQLVQRVGTTTTLVTAGTSLYLWDGTSGFTAKASVPNGSLFRDLFWPLGDYMLATDVSLQNVLKKWDGTTFSNAPTGLGVPLYAKYGVVHANRVWLFNITTNTTTPHLIVASAFENPASFDITNRGGPATYGGGTFAAGTEAFYMTTPDLREVNGVALFQNTLLISTKNGRMFQLVGSNANDFRWLDFIDGSPAIGDESLANIGNDVVFMRNGGHINSLSATQNFGNATTGELTRWLKGSIANLTGANQIVYDIAKQKVLFFVPGKVLVFYKNLYAGASILFGKAPSPWSVYTTQHPNAFNTQAAKYMLIPGSTTYSAYWGDSTGNLFDLNGSASGDGGLYSIMFLRRSRHIGPELFQNPWTWQQKNIEGAVEYRRVGSNQLSLSFDWDDEYNTSQSVVTLRGPPTGDTAPYFGGSFYFNGTSYFNQGFSGSQRIADSGFSPSGKGPGFYLSVSANTNIQFQVDSIQLQ